MGCSGSCAKPSGQRGINGAIGNGDSGKTSLLSPTSAYSYLEHARPKKPSLQAKDVILNAHVPLFSHFDENDHKVFFEACEQFELKAGTVVVQQQDMGDAFYAILQGEAAVIVDREQVDTWKKGDTFGALSLLRPEPRPETVEAETTLSILRMTREAFVKAGLQRKLKGNRRVGVGYDVGLEADPMPPTKKTASEVKFLSEALQSNVYLRLLSLDGSRIRQLVSVAWREEYNAGATVVQKKGVADRFFVIESGEVCIEADSERNSDASITEQSFQVSKSVGGVKRASVRSRINRTGTGTISRSGTTTGSSEKDLPLLPPSSDGLQHVSAGGCFGEVDLLHSLPRAATVFANSDSVVWVIAKKDLKNTLLEVSNETIERYMTYLRELQSLRFLFSHERRSLAQAMAHMNFHKHDTDEEFIIQQGVPAPALYLVLSGHVAILKDNKVVERLSVGEQLDSTCCGVLHGLNKYMSAVRRVKAPYVIGESALTGEVPSEFSVQVCSEVVSTLVLSSETVDLLIGSLEYLTKTRSKDRLVAVLKRIMLARRFASHFKKEPRKREHVTAMADIEKVADLGCGGFGTVELWQHKRDKTKYAMKILDKGHVCRKKAQKQVMQEKEIMRCMNSQFIIRLVEAYRTKNKLYLLLEVASGGELATVYRRRRLYGSEKHTKYYSAGVICAFEHIHKKRIIYRDLKPENTLLDGHGQPKLTDFGLAKYTVGRTFTVCGTPGYIAPEMVLHTGYTRSVDWWCFGVFVYELMHGSTPFGDEVPTAQLKRLSTGQLKGSVFKLMDKIDFRHGAVGDLVDKLLQFEPQARLPLKAGGISNVEKHDWYKGLNWEVFRQGRAEPPYIPKCPGGRVDTDNFNTLDLERYSETFLDDGSDWDAKFATV